MSKGIDIARLDRLIRTKRAKFRKMLDADPALFGGIANPRVEHTIGVNAPFGTIGVPAGVDIHSTLGLMRGVDLTLLTAEATAKDAEALARRAVAESSATICVYPKFVGVVWAVTGGKPPPIAVVGFPYVEIPGSQETAETLAQTRASLQKGAREIDMVFARIFKDEKKPDYAAHYNYIRSIVVGGEGGGTPSINPIKVILETSYLTDAQKVEACMIAKMAGARFVKTATGFALDEFMRPEIPKTQKGATPPDVALMRRTVGDTTLDDKGCSVPMGVKASGGVRNRLQAIAVYQAGANRIGASGGIDLRSEQEIDQGRRDALLVSKSTSALHVPTY